MSLGNNIKRYRKEKGLTQKQLAESIGVVASTITKYENNQLEPNINALIKICNTLNIEIIQLIDDSIPTKKRNELFKLFLLNGSNDTWNIKNDKEIENKNDNIDNQTPYVISESIDLLKLITIFAFYMYPNKQTEYIKKFNNKENMINNSDADEIIKKVCDLVEFELYKIKNNK